MPRQIASTARLVTTTDELGREFRAWCGRANAIWIAAAWSKDCPLERALWKARQKIQAMIVGLDYCGTAPSFLRDFQKRIWVREPQGGTYHPKVYLFQDGDDYCCFVGSSNFTGGGFGTNIEANIVLYGKARSVFFTRARNYIEALAVGLEHPKKAMIDDYERRYKRIQALRKKFDYRVAKSTKTKAAKERASVLRGRLPDSLDLTWKEYLACVTARHSSLLRVFDNEAGEDSYLGTIKRAHGTLVKRKRLDAMSPEERRFVAGTVKNAGYFGGMTGAGRFMHQVNETPAVLDAALAAIPLTGKVEEAALEKFINKYSWKGAAVATGSRLLAMKRPDLFLCIDKKNRSQLADKFDVTARSMSHWDGYKALHREIWRCRWCKSGRPKSAKDRAVWNVRVAILDSLFYKP